MKRLIALLFAFALCFSVGVTLTFASGDFSAEAASSARAMCVMEENSGRILYCKNEKKQLPMASTTKIMTAITAIENAQNLDETFVISPKAVGVSGTSLYLREGEEMSLRDLLYGLMLVSGNDASVAIGERVGGDVNTFVAMMNALAAKIGAVNTHFDNTHGLDSESHYTSAEDLARITTYAMKNDTFRQIVSTKNTKITSAAGKTRYLKNKNKLLSSLEGCDGVKTGFTSDAGRCLVTSAERGGMRVVAVVLNCGPMFEECASLINSAFAEYKLYDLSQNYPLKSCLPVDDGVQENCKIKLEGGALYPLKEEEVEKVSYSLSLEEGLLAPVKSGKKVGQLDIYLDKDLLFSQKIYTIQDIAEQSLWFKIEKIARGW